MRRPARILDLLRGHPAIVIDVIADEELVRLVDEFLAAHAVVAIVIEIGHLGIGQNRLRRADLLELRRVEESVLVLSA